MLENLELNGFIASENRPFGQNSAAPLTLLESLWARLKEAARKTNSATSAK